jgi:hypothetical protein
MKFILTYIAILLLAHQEPKQSAYYPLKIGTIWEYKVSSPSMPEPGFMQVIWRITKHEKCGDVMCAYQESVRTSDGKVLETGHIAVRDDGIIKCSSNGDNYQPPFCILKLPPKKGESWAVDSKFVTQGFIQKGTFTAGEADVVVPSGKYKTVTTELSDLTANGVKVGMAMTSYYAEGVGLVKMNLKKMNGQETLVELTKFTPGK